jgi:hypothetical protein
MLPEPPPVNRAPEVSSRNQPFGRPACHRRKDETAAFDRRIAITRIHTMAGNRRNCSPELASLSMIARATLEAPT